ncbi:hypothetical protein ACIPZF_12200 [Pseudomonas sp. NPDC089752]|uniref:hypothetical protein n=1 Tax=Pseudomonas sp. NPDC089752 TaxID=3364472 RepID=UPI00381DA038
MQLVLEVMHLVLEVMQRWLGKDHVVEIKLSANSSEEVTLLLTPNWLNAEAVGDFPTDMVDHPLD